MKKSRFAGHRLRVDRRETPNGVFSLTKCIQPKRPALGETERNLIVASLRFCVERGDVEIAAFIVMPDHFHLLAALWNDLTVSMWMHRLMSFLAGKTDRSLRASACRWQAGFYDTEIRTKKQFHYLIDYIHDNPVRAGLVQRPEAWHASSAQSAAWVRLTW